MPLGPARTAPMATLASVLGALRAEGFNLVGLRQGLTLVHFSAQPEPFLAQKTPWTPPHTPQHRVNIPSTIPKRTPYPTESAYVELKSERV